MYPCLNSSRSRISSQSLKLLECSAIVNYAYKSVYQAPIMMIICQVKGEYYNIDSEKKHPPFHNNLL